MTKTFEISILATLIVLLLGVAPLPAADPGQGVLRRLDQASDEILVAYEALRKKDAESAKKTLKGLVKTIEKSANQVAKSGSSSQSTAMQWILEGRDYFEQAIPLLADVQKTLATMSASRRSYVSGDRDLFYESDDQDRFEQAERERLEAEREAERAEASGEEEEEDDEDEDEEELTEEELAEQRLRAEIEVSILRARILVLEGRQSFQRGLEAFPQTAG